MSLKYLAFAGFMLSFSLLVIELLVNGRFDNGWLSSACWSCVVYSELGKNK